MLYQSRTRLAVAVPAELVHGLKLHMPQTLLRMALRRPDPHGGQDRFRSPAERRVPNLPFSYALVRSSVMFSVSFAFFVFFVLFVSLSAFGLHVARFVQSLSPHP